MMDENDLSALLQARALRLAVPARLPKAIGDVAALVAFDIGRERFLLPATAVGEILRGPRASALPGLPHAVEGVIAVRGRIVPLVRLDQLLGDDSEEDDSRAPAQCIVMAEAPLALRAHRLVGARPRSDEPAAPLPTYFTTELKAVADGIVDDRVLLNAARLTQWVVATLRGSSAHRPSTQHGDHSRHAVST